METESLYNRLTKRLRKKEPPKIPIILTSVPLCSESAFYNNYIKMGKELIPHFESEARAYMLVTFIPWHESPNCNSEYDGFTLTKTEADLRMKYGLTNSQLQWRRDKIASYGGDMERFKQEWPSR